MKTNGSFRLSACVLALSSFAGAAEYAPPPLPPEVVIPTHKTIKLSEAGGTPDGKTLCTDAIGKAIDECSHAGGGVVEFDRTAAGVEYLTGAIHLKSNITLQVDKDVTLKFTTDRA